MGWVPDHVNIFYCISSLLHRIYSKICSSASKDFSLIIRLLLLLPPPICSRGKWQKHLIVVRESSQEDKKKKFMWLMCCLTCQIYVADMLSDLSKFYVAHVLSDVSNWMVFPSCWHARAREPWTKLSVDNFRVSWGLFEESRRHLIISVLSLEIGNIWVCMFPWALSLFPLFGLPHST
jgi:hypothetical protein